MSNNPVNHNQPWTLGEDTRLLNEWATKDISVGEQKTIAQSMGRTFETCRTRVTIIKKRHGIEMRDEVERPRSKEKVYIGAMDDPEECWWL